MPIHSVLKEISKEYKYAQKAYKAKKISFEEYNDVQIRYIMACRYAEQGI